MFRRLPLPIAAMFVLAVVLAVLNLWEDQSLQYKKSLLRKPGIGATARIIAAELWARDEVNGLPELLEALHSGDPQIRVAGVVGLGRIGPAASQSLPELIDGLHDPVDSIRRACVESLANVESDRTAVSSLIAPLLCDESADVRLSTMQRLHALGRFAVPTIAELLRTSRNPEGQCEAIRLLVQIGAGPAETTDLFRHTFEDPAAAPSVRETALLALLALRTATPDEIATALNCTSQDVVTRALQQSAAYPDESRLDGLVVILLDDPNADVRRAARMALQRRAIVPHEAAARLHALLPMVAAEEALQIARCLRKLDPEDPDAIAALRDLAGDPDSLLAHPAARELQNCAFEDFSQIVGNLAAAAERGQTERRIRALDILAALGSHSHAAIPSLIVCLGEDRNDSRDANVDTNPQSNSSDRPEEDSQVRLAALRVVQRIGAAATDAVPCLIRLLELKARERESLERIETIAALACIGPGAEPAVPLLNALADEHALRADRAASSNWLQRVHALSALGRLQKNVPDAVAIVLDAAGRNQPTPHALLALPRVGAKAHDAIPVLRKTLASTDGLLRCAACTALGEYGPDAAVAAPELSYLLKDTSPRLQTSAVETLRRIGPPARKAVPALVALAIEIANTTSARATMAITPRKVRRAYYDFSRREREFVLESDIWAAIEAIAPESVDELRRDVGPGGSVTIP